MSRFGLIALLWSIAVAMPSYVCAVEPEMSKPAVSPAEIKQTVVAVESHLDAVRVLIEERDAKLEVLLNELDETEDPARKASLQSLVDKLTRALDRLEAVKADLSTKLDGLKIQIDRLKEP